MVRQSEIIQDQLSIQNETAKSTEETNKQRYPKRNEQRYPKRDNYTRKESFSNRRQAETKRRGCSRSGLSHGSSCPAKNAKCNKCNKIGHYARCCKTKQLTEVSCRYTTQKDGSLICQLMVIT